MLPSFKHPWPLDPAEAERLQRSLAPRVVTEDRLPAVIRWVAGVDVAYEKVGDRLFSAIVVLDAESLETVETATAAGTTTFPYVPGLFSFRELPALSVALAKLQTTPDLVVCDGQGIAHPRRLGLASHFGVLFDVPTIGCGKTRFVGEHTVPAPQRGDFAELVDRGEVIGSVLRTQADVKPLYVSVGHRIALPTARQWILRLAPKYRQPEPIRRVNELVNELRHAAG